MDTTPRVGVTNSAGDVGPDGDLVGQLCKRIGTAIELGRCERPGFDERLAAAGADTEEREAIRRMIAAAP